jgi:hypothetical protein
MTSDPSSEVSGLRSEIRNFRSEISDLKHQVGKVSRLDERLRTVEHNVEGVPSKLENLARKQKATQDSLDRLQEMYKRDRTVAIAYNEWAVADRKWQAKFGSYEDARNMAASIIDVVASGHIDRAVILDVTQRLAIKSPRYWVAQATLAIAAWLDDDQQKHQEALDYALRLDYEKTSLFMALLLRDQGRDKELQEWLAAYLSALTPVRLPRHFQVVIDAATGNALGGDAAPWLVKQVDEWYADEGARQDIFDTTVSEWKRRLLDLGARDGQHPGFPILSANQEAWRALSPRHEAIRAIEQAVAYFRERFDTGASVTDDIRKKLAGLLADLARIEDPEEEGLVSVMREHRAITQAEGDLNAARARVVADEESRRKTLNIVGMVSQSAFPTPDDGQPPAPNVTELLAIMFSSQFIVDAADELLDDLPRVDTIEITVGDRSWKCRFDCGDEAKTTRPALRVQAEEQARKVSALIQKEADRRQGRLRWLKKWGCPSGLVAAVGLGGAAFIPGDPRELVVGAFVVAVPSILGMNRLPKVVRRAASETEREKSALTDQLNAAADELADLWDADRRTIEIHLPDLRRYLLGLTRDSVSAAIRPVPDVPLPRTREFPGWTPSPPRRHSAIEPEDNLSALDD